MNEVSVTTTAISNELCTPDYVITRFNLASSDEENIEEVLEEVLSAFETYLGRPLARQTYSEKVPGYGEHNLRLSRYPVDTTGVTVTLGLESSSTAISSTEYLIDSSSGMLFNSTGWKWTAAWKGDIKQDKWPGSEEPSYVVTYSAGYHFPSTENPVCGAKFPADLRGAAMRTFQLWWTDLYGGSTDFKRYRTDDLEIENFAPPVKELIQGYGDIPESVERVLDRYKLEW
jgi:hypothetical protein